MTVVSADIGKRCFIKFKKTHGNAYSWENVGAVIMGVAKKHGDNKVIVKMPAGERVAVNEEDVRVLEPRPG